MNLSKNIGEEREKRKHLYSFSPDNINLCVNRGGKILVKYKIKIKIRLVIFKYFINFTQVDIVGLFWQLRFLREYNNFLSNSSLIAVETISTLLRLS